MKTSLAGGGDSPPYLQQMAKLTSEAKNRAGRGRGVHVGGVTGEKADEVIWEDV